MVDRPTERWKCQKHADAINWFVSEPDGGLGDAWNKGLKQAQGKYIALLNADDFYDSGFIAASISALREESDSVAYGTTVVVDPTSGFSQPNKPYFSARKSARDLASFIQVA